jgi:hypothetical protein
MLRPGQTLSRIPGRRGLRSYLSAKRPRAKAASHPRNSCRGPEQYPHAIPSPARVLRFRRSRSPPPAGARRGPTPGCRRAGRRVREWPGRLSEDGVGPVAPADDGAALIGPDPRPEPVAQGRGREGRRQLIRSRGSVLLATTSGAQLRRHAPQRLAERRGGALCQPRHPRGPGHVLTVERPPAPANRLDAPPGRVWLLAHGLQ